MILYPTRIDVVIHPVCMSISFTVFNLTRKWVECKLSSLLQFSFWLLWLLDLIFQACHVYFMVYMMLCMSITPEYVDISDLIDAIIEGLSSHSQIKVTTPIEKLILRREECGFQTEFAKHNFAELQTMV